MLHCLGFVIYKKTKYEVYTKKSGDKKIIFVYEPFDKIIFVISGAERK